MNVNDQRVPTDVRTKPLGKEVEVRSLLSGSEVQRKRDKETATLSKEVKIHVCTNLTRVPFSGVEFQICELV